MVPVYFEIYKIKLLLVAKKAKLFDACVNNRKKITMNNDPDIKIYTFGT